MRFSIRFKLIFLVVASVAIATTAALITSYITIGQGFKNELLPNVKADQRIIQDRIDRMKDDYTRLAMAQSLRAEVIDAMHAGDRTRLQRYGQQLIKAGQTDFIVFTDAKGTVLARGHDDASGDSIAQQECIVKALSGEQCATFERGTVVKLSMRAAVPVTRDGVLIGTITVGMNISRNDALVDSFKQLIDAESTIFWGDSRESTTIVIDGKRAVDTKLDNQEVRERVLRRGELYSVEITLFQRPYLAVYWPMLDASSKPVGMFFIGKEMSSAEESRWDVFKTILLVCLAVMALLAVAGYFASRKLTRPILALADYSQAVAGGDYAQTLHIDLRDELGDLATALKSMVNALKEKIAAAQSALTRADRESQNAHEASLQADAARAQAVKARAEGMLQAASQLQGVVEVVTSASEELSAQIEQSSRGSAEQSHRAEETATAMEEMNATVREVAGNASQATETADRTKKEALDGSLVVSQVVRGIGEVQDQALAMKTDMTSLGKQAEGIGHILNVISDIADQTNLLALNAAIEAARAGDAGRGFAVVADEVRKLAEKTMTATKEVGDAIHGIQNATTKNIENVEQSVKKIDAATRLANASGEALREIVHLVELTTDQVRSIASASEQQSAASEKITRSIEDVNRISSETSDAMRQSAQAVGELAHQSQVLKGLIDQMKKDGDGSTGPKALHQRRSL